MRLEWGNWYLEILPKSPRFRRRWPGTVLLVTVSKVLARLIQVNLERRGSEVTVLGAGQDAVAFAEQQLPDLLILDCDLPEVDLRQLLASIRADPSSQDLPIIALRQQPFRSPIVPGGRIGISKCLTKPLKPMELVASIERIFSDDPPDDPTVWEERFPV